MRRTFLAVISTIVGLVMLLSFKTQSTRPNGLSALGAPGTGSGPAPAAPPTPGRSSAPAAAATRTVDGQTVETGYGPVQVQITLRGGRIVQVRPLHWPSDASRSYSISSYAIPILMKETLAAQSAHIDSVSGASYTSQGYVQSLQSALDAARA